jgi:hypothetical protein
MPVSDSYFATGLTNDDDDDDNNNLPLLFPGGRAS